MRPKIRQMSFKLSPAPMSAILDAVQAVGGEPGTDALRSGEGDATPMLHEVLRWRTPLVNHLRFTGLQGKPRLCGHPAPICLSCTAVHIWRTENATMECMLHNCHQEGIPARA